jgi:GntR family transcriptional regulator
MHSGFVISRSDGRPMYLQIIEQIKERIAVGDWPRGAEIPSIRQLAATLRVSVITIKRVYQELEREGVIITQQGKGSAVSDDPNVARFRDNDLVQHLDQAARLGTLLGYSPDELATHMRDAAKKIAEEPL